MTTRARRERSDQADRFLLELFSQASGQLQIDQNSFFDVEQLALIALGSFGRGELALGSDLDILILHQKNIESENLNKFVQNFIYPIWNTNWKLDYSVRTIDQSLEQSYQDVRVAMGLLDARLIFGNQESFDNLQKNILKLWRKEKKHFLSQISQNLSERRERAGNCAFLLEPDIKEARGGLRDINILKAMLAFSENKSDFPIAHDRLENSFAILSNVRDLLHENQRTPKDILNFELQDKIAPLLGLRDADELLLTVSKAARTVTYLINMLTHRLALPDNFYNKRKARRRDEIEPGIYLQNGEICFDYQLGSQTALHAAALAAQRGVPLNSESCLQLVENFQDLSRPWPRSSREDFVTLLGAGRSTISVFEILDQEGLLELWIPEWKHLQYLPQRNALHRHTVDRHSLETVFHASALTRTVRRPDLLLVAALFHDLGKGYPDHDHSEHGAKLIYPLAKNLGFKENDALVLQLLVKEHLTLSATATRRDLDDPATFRYLQEIIPDLDTLNLLHALSIADGQATGSAAWNDWKAKLVQTLVSGSTALREGISLSTAYDLTTEQKELMAKKEMNVRISELEDSFEIEVIAPDRTGLLSRVAGVLSILRAEIRSARTKTIGDMAIMRWIVIFDPLAPIPSAGKVAALIEEAFEPSFDLNTQIENRISHFKRFPGIVVAPPVVTAKNDQATNATLLEIRMHDQPGLLYSITKTLSRFSVDIQAALVSTLGAEALDTLYVTDLAGRPLDEMRATHLASQLETYLSTQ